MAAKWRNGDPVGYSSYIGVLYPNEIVVLLGVKLETDEVPGGRGHRCCSSNASFTEYVAVYFGLHSTV